MVCKLRDLRTSVKRTDDQQLAWLHCESKYRCLRGMEGWRDSQAKNQCLKIKGKRVWLKIRLALF